MGRMRHRVIAFVGVHSRAPAARPRRGPSAEQAAPRPSDRRTGAHHCAQSKRAPRLRPLHSRGEAPRSQSGAAAEGEGLNLHCSYSLSARRGSRLTSRLSLDLCQGGGPEPPNRIPLTPCTVSFSCPAEPTSRNPSTLNPAPHSRHGAPQAAHVMARATESSQQRIFPRESSGPRGSLTQHPPIPQHGPLQHGPASAAAIPKRLGRLNSQAPARPTHADGRAWIAGRQFPAREIRGVDPSTPATPNRRGAPLAMAATCRPVLRRSNPPAAGPKLRAPCHPSAGAILSPSIRGDSRCPRSHFPRQAARPRPGTLLDPEGSHF